MFVQRHKNVSGMKSVTTANIRITALKLLLTRGTKIGYTIRHYCHTAKTTMQRLHKTSTIYIHVQANEEAFTSRQDVVDISNRPLDRRTTLTTYFLTKAQTGIEVQ